MSPRSRLALLALLSAACSSSGNDSAPPGSSDSATDSQVGDSAQPDSGQPDSPPDVNGRLDSIDGRDLLYMWGTREEMGYAEGSLLCGRLTRLFEDYVLNYMVASFGFDWETLLSIGLAWITIPDGDMAELQGIADGMRDNCPAEDLIVTSDYLGLGEGGSRELTLDDLVVASALGDFACSSFTAWGAASASGATIHGRNFDYSIDPGGTFLDEHIVKLYQSDDEGGARYLSISVPGLVGCMSCFTEEGVGITMHNVTGLSSDYGSGYVPRMLATRSALAATVGAEDPVAAADEVLEAAPQYRGNNLHISFPCDGGDCAGGAIFEYDGHVSHEDGQTTVRVPGSHQEPLETDLAIACTNHYMQREEPETSGDSANRYGELSLALNDALGTGGVDADMALEMLHGVSKSYTAHSVVMDTASMQLQLHVSEEKGESATSYDPVLLDFAEVFAGFDE